MNRLLLKAAWFCGLFAFQGTAAAQTWTQVTNVSTDYWISVAASADGTKLVAASWTGQIVTSTNSGVTWNVQRTNQDGLYPVACSADGSILLVAQFQGVIGYYDSSASWTTPSFGLGEPGNWWGVACSADANVIVGVSQGHPPTVPALGPDNFPGIWTWYDWLEDPNFLRNPYVSNNVPVEAWQGVACSADGTRIVAVGIGAVFNSADSGHTWHQQALQYTNLNWWAVASSADGLKLVAVAFGQTGGQIYTSTSGGADWTLTSAPNATWSRVASSADGTRLVATIYGGGIYNSVDSGLTWRLNNAPINYWEGVASSADGRKLTALAYGGGIYTGELPPLYTTMSATPRRVPTGTNIQVVVTVENDDTNMVTNISVAGGIVVTGDGGVSVVADNSTSLLTELLPGQSASFTNIYLATNNGTATFTATLQGNTILGPEPDSTCSAQVLIVPNGDLLIKRAEEPVDDYAGLGIFQTVPIAPQVVTNVVAGTNDLSQFEVQIQNNDPQTQTYLLAAAEGGTPYWKIIILLGSNDVTAQVEAPGGMTLPAMAPGTALTLTVTMQDTNGSPGDIYGVEFALGLASNPSLFLDAVEAITQLVPEIVVNSTGDLPMLDTNGCCCDTGRTLTNGEAECTLRAALQLANRNPGKDIIKFQIPAGDPGIRNGVPSLQPKTALPDITDSVVIDGWSQSPSASSPPVELSGVAVSDRVNAHGKVYLGDAEGSPFSVLLRFYNLLQESVPSGLHVVADGCEIHGLVVNFFPDCGILVDGSDTIIQGNYFGTDPVGTASEPSGLMIEIPTANNPWGGGGAQLCLRSPGNLVGGSDVHSGNVISGGPEQILPGGYTLFGWVGTVGLAIYGGAANGNVVEGNIIGLNASANATPSVSIPPLPLGGSGISHTGSGGCQLVGILIYSGSGNRVGGGAAGTGNIIAGNVTGVDIAGGSAHDNVIAGNQIGWNTGYSVGNNAQSEGVSIDSQKQGLLDTNVDIGRPQQNIVGGPAAGAGNSIGGTSLAGIFDNGVSDTIQNNYIGVMPDGKTPIPAGGGNGIYAWASQSPQISYNTIVNCADGIKLEQTPSGRVLRNQISTSGENGISVILPSGGTVISLNTISLSGVSQTDQRFHLGDGVFLNNCGAVTISQNSIGDSTGLGIGANGQPVGQPQLDSDGHQPISIFFSHPPPVYGGGQLQITGTVEAPAGGGTYLLEFFGSAYANLSGYGEGRTFLGSEAVTVDLLGNGVINVTLPCPNSPGNYLTATATAPDGTTSEFSKAVLIQPCLPGVKGLCPGIEANVPNLNTGGSSQIRTQGPVPPTPSPSFGDGNGDGILDSLESNIASFPTLQGLWVTLAANSGTTLENVTPTGPPDFTSLPAGYNFPIGFVSFGITNLPAGGVVTITNYLHLDADTNFSYSASTYFNYGPTPDNHTPHWYQFLYDGTNGAELFPDHIILHYHDGARGDHDLSVNSEIVTVGAPAYQLPPVPQLSIAVASVGSSNIVDITTGTNGISSLVTNAMPVVTSVLSWPASATNYALHYVSDLSSLNSLDGLPGLFWQPLPVSPVIVNGQNVVTNTVFGPTGFYELQ